MILGHPSLVIATAVLLEPWWVSAPVARWPVCGIGSTLSATCQSQGPGGGSWPLPFSPSRPRDLADTHPMAAHGLALLPLAVAGPALAAIDLDVHRLPNRILHPSRSRPAALAAAALAVGEPLHILWAVTAAVATLAVLER